MPRHPLPTRALLLATGLALCAPVPVLAEGGGRDPGDTGIYAETTATQAMKLTPKAQAKLRKANSRLAKKAAKDALRGRVSGKGYTRTLTKSVMGLLF